MMPSSWRGVFTIWSQNSLHKMEIPSLISLATNLRSKIIKSYLQSLSREMNWKPLVSHSIHKILSYPTHKTVSAMVGDNRSAIKFLNDSCKWQLLSADTGNAWETINMKTCSLQSSLGSVWLRHISVNVKDLCFCASRRDAHLFAISQHSYHRHLFMHYDEN